jgi:hypothetical protein
MKILLLVSDDFSAYYSAALMQRGHQFITQDRGVSRSENPADWDARDQPIHRMRWLFAGQRRSTNERNRGLVWE